MKTISLKSIDQTGWLKLRRLGIGGSDVAAILGLSKWKTPLDVYNDKVSTDEPTEIDNPSMEWGRRLEPLILEKYNEVTGASAVKPDVMFASEERPFMVANLDGLTPDGRVVEIKTARTASGWGEEGTDEIPEYYATQVHHYLSVMGAAECDVAVLIGASDFRVYTVKRDEELIGMLVAEEEKFWRDHVEARVPPAPRTLEEMAQAFPVSEPETREATDDISETLQTIVQLEREIAEKKSEADELRAKVEGFMEAAEGLSIDGVTAVTWKSSKPRVTVDTKALQKDLPGIYKQYLKEGSPSRRFTIKQAYADSVAQQL